MEERPRIEGNLPEVWREALAVLGGLMRQPSRLLGSRFRPVSEYPRFSWQEALLNAIATAITACRATPLRCGSLTTAWR